MLDDPNVWIGDTAATVHMTPHAQGMVNVRKASKEDTVTMGNKEVEQSTKIGDIPGTICDMHGDKVKSSCLKDVKLVPRSGYNLFSLTKMMLQGWKLVGEDNMLKLNLALRPSSLRGTRLSRTVWRKLALRRLRIAVER
jgi:hypothetical protein